MSNDPKDDGPHDFPNLFWRWGRWAANVLHDNKTHIVWAFVTLTSIGLTWLANKAGVPAPPIPDIVPIGQVGGMGWIQPTDEETSTALTEIAAEQGMPAQFSRIGQAAMAAADDHSQFLWLAEQKVLGKILGSWDQGPYGECVSFGWGRAAQDCLLTQIAQGSNEQWPGHEVATEPIYGGSRVEIGHGRIRGDGSVGAWAGQWVQKYGLLFRQKYGNVDLSTYSGQLGRQWGKSGVPGALEIESKKHPVKTVAQIQTGDELWAALGNSYPVAVCSNVGFNGAPPPTGIMQPNGTWGHCMLFRGRFTHPTAGRCVVIQNSWGAYIPRITVQTTDAGAVPLPEGCFAVSLSVGERMCRQNDTFAVSGVVGFPAQRIVWPAMRRAREPLPFASFPFAGKI